MPYLNKFLKSNPDDATLIQVRDRYGVGSILRLQDYPATRDLAEPLLGKLSEAARRHATARADRPVHRRPDQDARGAGIRRRAAPRGRAVRGPAALAGVVKKPASSAEDRALLVRNMGRLDRPAVPALIAALDAPDPRLAADAAEALGRIGDPRAVPALTALAAVPGPPAPPRPAHAARRAVERITGAAFRARSRSRPRGCSRTRPGATSIHAVRFPGDPVAVWAWDPAAQAPAPKSMARAEAESYFGLKLARAALAIDPSDRPAQVVLLGLALEDAIDGGSRQVPGGRHVGHVRRGRWPPARLVLGDVLRDGDRRPRSALAAVAATALGRVADAKTLAARGPITRWSTRSRPPTGGSGSPPRGRSWRSTPDARSPGRAGSCRCSPSSSRPSPRPAPWSSTATPPRGSQLAGYLNALGYDPVLAPTGDEGFRVAADSADVELILVDHHMILGDWRLHDTLANLAADARTAGLPVYVVGPLAREVDLNALLTERFPGVRFLVTPTDRKTLAEQLAIAGRPPMPPRPRSAAGYAREAAALLAADRRPPGQPVRARPGGGSSRR